MPKIEVLEGVHSVPREEWNALVGDESPFLEWEWLASLEEAGCLGEQSGWFPRPLVAYEDNELVAACPVYVKLNSEGEFVYDWGWADAAHRAGISYYPKLLVGVPFSPVTGARFLVKPGQDRNLWIRRFAAYLREMCEPNDLSGVHVNFCRPDELAALGEAGYMQRTGFQYHWCNEGYADFEEYLMRFRSKRRNQIRRERRELVKESIHLECITGDDLCEADIEHAFRFYQATVQNHHYGRQYLNREVFDLLFERFSHRIVLSLARQGGNTIGGTFNIFKGDTLYGRYWGADRYVRHLHFNACYYAPIEFCIERGLTRFEPGAGGDYKQIRGFDAQATYSGHYLQDPRLSQAIARFLESERDHADETISWIRDHSALKSTPSSE